LPCPAGRSGPWSRRTGAPEASATRDRHPPSSRARTSVTASRALLATLEHTETHNEYLPDESGAFCTDVKFPESDHAPVVAQFTLLDG
jgi:hypothetical protein